MNLTYKLSITAALCAFMLGAQPTHKPTITPPQLTPPASAYRFTALLIPGMTIGGHSFTPDTVIDSATSFNDAGDAAFIATWSDRGSGKVQRAVFTAQRLIATEGDAVDGKTLVRINTASLTLNNAGAVAFEAIYSDAATLANSKTGVFIEKRFIGDITPSANGSDFAFLDDGRILSHDGTIVSLPVPPAPVAIAAAPAAPKAVQPQKQGPVIHLSPKALKWLHDHSPLQTDGDPLAQATAPPTPSAPPTPVPVAVQPKPVLPPALPVPTFPHARTAPCPAPAFPMPVEWQMGGDSSGPIAVHAFDGPVQGRIYTSPIYGKFTSPIRTIHYANDCRALLIAIGDTTAKGRFEVWTPEGSLTYLNSDGTWNFPGIPLKITSGSFLRDKSGLSINRKGQILLLVTLAEGSTLLLATPSH
jgi:hypothetical protein